VVSYLTCTGTLQSLPHHTICGEEIPGLLPNEGAAVLVGGDATFCLHVKATTTRSHTCKFVRVLLLIRPSFLRHLPLSVFCVRRNGSVVASMSCSHDLFILLTSNRTSVAIS